MASERALRTWPADDEPGAGLGARPAGRRRRKLRVFALVFGVCATVGLVYTFARPPVYSTAATLLVEPPAGAAEEASRNLQHLATERERLTSREVLSRTLERVEATPSPPGSYPGSVAELGERLSAEYAGETNLMELRAEGAEPGPLPELVNAWLNAYLQARAEANRSRSAVTDSTLRERITELERRVADKRAELQRFRIEHDIVSMERGENQALARLNALNEALNQAREEQVAAEAELEAVRDALARGEPVIAPSEERTIANLEDRAAQLRQELGDYAQRFTPEYMAIDPKIVAMRERLEELEASIAARREEGRQAVVTQARQAVASARQRVATLSAELETFKAQAAEFSARFAEHEALQEELAQLETRLREAKQRLVESEVAQQDLFPAVSVIERAHVPESPVRPDYTRDAGIALGGSLLLGLLAVLVYELFTRPAREARYGEGLPSIYSYSTQIFPPHEDAPERLPAQTRALEHQQNLPRELAEPEVRALLQASDPAGRALMGLLLSGVGLGEAARLRWTDVDFDEHVVRIGGAHARSIPLAPRVRGDLWALRAGAQGPDAPVWGGDGGELLSEEDLGAMVACAAHDAGLAQAGEVGPEVLRHTYLAFLVRQGLRLGELDRVVGTLPRRVSAAYGTLSPPTPGVPLSAVRVEYPALCALEDDPPALRGGLSG